MGKTVCFDLEGPISPQDNAFDVMGLVSDGRRIFSLLSAYDDELALEGKRGYEPGDTLKLVIPFLLAGGIKNQDITVVSDKAVLVDGVAGVIEKLKSCGWKVSIISTSYEQHALNIASKVGVDSEDVYCTRLDLDSLRKKTPRDSLAIAWEIKDAIIGLENNPRQLKTVLDEFYWKKIPETTLGGVMDEVSVCGGARKVAALETVSRKTGTPLSGLMVVGDSITDCRMLGKVRDAGGLSVVFNGNTYALPCGNVGLASKTMEPLLEIAGAFSGGGMDAVKKLAGEQDKSGEPYLHLLNDKVSGEVISAHKQMRKHCRGRAAELG